MLTTTKTISSKLFKPSFEIDFWLKHFRGFNNHECRSFEAFCMQPIAETMFFADTVEDASDDVRFDFSEYLEPFCQVVSLEDQLMEMAESEDDDSYGNSDDSEEEHSNFKGFSSDDDEDWPDEDDNE